MSKRITIQKLDELLKERLGELETPLDESTPPELEAPAAGLRGWTWECDEQGNYLHCSSEVEEVLGLPAAGFTGQPLAQYAVAEGSPPLALETLPEEALPVEAALIYQASDGRQIAASLCIFAAPPVTGGSSGRRGFTQVWFDADTGLTGMDGITDRTTGKKSQEGEGLELYQQASQKLAEILESIRQNAFPVRDAPVSSTSAQEKADLKEDRSRDPVLVSSFGGKKIYAYPKRLAHEIEHRLEWGSKLDLTDEERAYIRSNKNLPTGPLKYFTLRSAPKEIVKRDMKWITATITAIEDAEQYVSISSPSSGPDSVRMDLADFLKNPAVLQADLMQALQDPWISRTVLELGKDYLVRK